MHTPLEGLEPQPAPVPQPRRWPVYWLLIANLISNLGNNITVLAIPWFVYATTGSAGQVGLVAAATLLPMVISTFIGGTLTDRMSHRQLAVMSDVLSGLTVAAIPLLHYTTGITITALMVLVFLGAVFDGPGMNARMTMIPKLAACAGMPLERVNSIFDMGRSALNLIGAPIAGLLVAMLGAAGALWITAATFAISAAIVRLLLPATTRPEPTGTTMWEDMKEGLRFLFSSRLLRSIALTATVLNMVISPVFTIGMPVYITNIGRDAGSLGLLMTSLAAGALTGGLIYGWVGDRLPPRLTLVVSLMLIVGPLYGVATEPGLVVMWFLMFALNVGAGIVNPLVITFFQRHTPEAMLGRAMGTFISTAMLASPVGMLIGGWLIASQGFGIATLSGTIAMSIVAVLLMFNRDIGDLVAPKPAPS